MCSKAASIQPFVTSRSPLRAVVAHRSQLASDRRAGRTRSAVRRRRAFPGAGLPYCRVTLKATWQHAAYPNELKRLGDHLRKRRLDLGLSQSETACRLGVKKDAVQFWERGRFAPTVSCLPRVIRFLGYDPRPEPVSLPEWLVWYRAGRGLSQATMARRLGVASRTLCLWETGQRRPTGENLVKLSELGRSRNDSHQAVGDSDPTGNLDGVRPASRTGGGVLRSGQ